MPRKKTHRITRLTIALLIVFSFVAGGLGGAISTQLISHFVEKSEEATQIVQEKTQPEIIKEIVTENYIEESSIIETVEKVSPAVVSVVVTKDLPLYKQNFYYDPFEDFFNDDFFGFPQFEMRTPQYRQPNNSEEPRTEKRKVGGGSGFIFSQDGLVITNKHVVEDENAEYTVILNDATEYPAEVLGLDPLNDLAVLKINPESESEEEIEVTFPFIALGDSNEMKVGQRVVAIGNALAEYENTVTTGVISAKDRSIVAGGSMQGTESLNNLLQTDAAINPGNSGGPLVNLNGEVIGINTAIATNANGIGFAIPINDAKQVVESVKKHGRIVRPMLGIRYALITPENKESLDYEQEFEFDYGALITGDPNAKQYAVVPNSPADKAGLMRDDIVLEVNGEKIDNANKLREVATQHQIGDILKLKVWREGEIFETDVELGEIDTEKEAPEIQEQ